MGIEKLMSGMFIGEVVRQVLLKMHEKKLLLSSWPKEWHNTYSLHTETVSSILGPTTSEEHAKFCTSLGISNIPKNDFSIIRLVCEIVVIRAAYLTAACTSCLANRVEQTRVGIAVDGSVFKNIQLFQDVLQEKIQSLIKPGKQCYFVPCEDGSGIGAALVAAMVTKAKT